MTKSTLRVCSEFIVRCLMFSALGWILLYADPFGVGSATDEASQNAFYKILAPWYPDDAQQDIVVILLDSDSIDQLHQWRVFGANEWPVLYSDHADIISRILKYQPRALLVDIYFKKRRVTDNSYSELFRRVSGALHANGGKTRLFFGGGGAMELATGKTRIQQDLDKLADLTVIGWEVSSGGYPIQVEITTPDGHNKVLNTAAWDLYRAACLSNQIPLAGCNSQVLEEPEDDLISVRWGDTTVSRLTLGGQYTSNCESQGNAVFQMMRTAMEGFFKDVIDTPVRDRCPYHNSITASQLIYFDKILKDQDGSIRKLLQDKLVIYATNFQGLGDVIESPVHGYLPGAFLHAMAIDNLMVLGKNYTKASSSNSTFISFIIWFVLSTFISSLILYRDLKNNESCLIASVAVRKEIVNKSISCPEGIKAEQKIYPSTSLSWISVFLSVGLIVPVISLLLFYWFDYEPMNSLGFLGLSALMAILIKNEKAELYTDRIVCISKAFIDLLGKLKKRSGCD